MKRKSLKTTKAPTSSSGQTATTETPDQCKVSKPRTDEGRWDHEGYDQLLIEQSKTASKSNKTEPTIPDPNKPKKSNKKSTYPPSESSFAMEKKSKQGKQESNFHQDGETNEDNILSGQRIRKSNKKKSR